MASTLALTAPVMSRAGEAPSVAEMQRAPADGGVRRWAVAPGGDLSLRAAPSGDAAAVTIQAEGAVLMNLGCATAGDQLWCQVRPYRGGAKGYAPADRLLPATGPDGVVPMGIDESRQRARKHDFDAEGEIPCAQEQGQALGRCAIAVARDVGGDATAVVTFPNGFKRNLYFAHGAFVSASATMSGVGRDTDWQVDDGLHRIRVDDQRYEIPSTLIFGD
ncbi:MAG: hypothetical protein AAF675_13335 [Pseudomonadota bacterium]